MNFGRKQLNNPTPASMEFYVKVFVIVSGIFCAWMPTNNLISHHVQDIVTPLANLFNSIALSLLPLFGVDIKSKTVPVEDAKVVEENNVK